MNSLFTAKIAFPWFFQLHNIQIPMITQKYCSSEMVFLKSWRLLFLAPFLIWPSSSSRQTLHVQYLAILGTMEGTQFIYSCFRGIDAIYRRYVSKLA